LENVAIMQMHKTRAILIALAVTAPALVALLPQKASAG
jgi:hypothetical protein